MVAMLLMEACRGTEIGRKSFSDLPTAMFGLTFSVVFPDAAAMMTRLGSTNIMAVLSFFFFVVNSIIILNVLIGAICQVISAVSESAHETHNVNKVEVAFQKIFNDCNLD